MPGNAGGAKGAGHLGLLGGQPAPVWLGGAKVSEPKPFAISKWVVWRPIGGSRRTRERRGRRGVDGGVRG